MCQVYPTLHGRREGEVGEEQNSGKTEILDSIKGLRQFDPPSPPIKCRVGVLQFGQHCMYFSLEGFLNLGVKGLTGVITSNWVELD